MIETFMNWLLVKSDIRYYCTLGIAIILVSLVVNLLFEVLK